ncbi:sulfite exporter TauE/SafE family protein [Phytohabitans kaempferiae]|uniref:Probable membrane transporter protein n=1 Tax=Phytohabitans kaempferiae TaxID=1620943 RepID=A0ABV6MFK7_9ACTN
MDLPGTVLLAVAGLAAGAVNAIAGGGSLITFPALIAAGLAPIPANVTNSVAVSPGYIGSVVGSRADIPRERVRALVPIAALGGFAGCLLLLATPARAFELVVPFLVLAAAAVLAFQDRLRRLVGHPRTMSPARNRIGLYALVAAGGVYGGYFGAALGVMLVAGLALLLDERLARVNALKNVLSGVVGVVTVVAYAALGPVDWAGVAVIAPATLLGGYAGAHLARHLPSAVLKATIVTAGTAVGLSLLVRAFS